MYDLYVKYSVLGHIIIMGDFNGICRYADFNSTNYYKSRVICKFLVPINTQPICNGSQYSYVPCKTIIDHIITDGIMN